MYYSVSFTTCTDLYDQHHNQDMEHFQQLKKFPYVVLSCHPPLSPAPTPVNRWSLLCHYLFFSRMSYKWNHRVCNLLRLASFPHTNVSEILLSCCDHHSFPSVAELYSIVWRYHSLCGHSVVEGHWGSFQFGAIVNRMAINVQLLETVTCRFWCGCDFWGADIQKWGLHRHLMLSTLFIVAILIGV